MTTIQFLTAFAMLMFGEMPLVISQNFFIAIVGIGIVGTIVVGIIIITYTVKEFRNKEIW